MQRPYSPGPASILELITHGGGQHAAEKQNQMGVGGGPRALPVMWRLAAGGPGRTVVSREVILPLRPSSDRMRPTHNMERDLLYSKSVDLSVNLIKINKPSQHHPDCLSKYLESVAKPSGHKIHLQAHQPAHHEARLETVSPPFPKAVTVQGGTGGRVRATAGQVMAGPQAASLGL